MSNVHYLESAETYTVEQALEAAKHKGFTDVLVVGWDGDGDFVALSSRMAASDALWLAEKAKLHALGVAND